MGERLSTLVIIVLLALLALLTFWLERVVQEITPVRDKPPAHEADYIADKLFATRMGLDGRVRDTLHAVKLTHYPDDDRTELASPRFVTYGREAPLAVTATQAKITGNVGNIYFMGNVLVRRGAANTAGASRAAHAPGGEMTVSTEYLHVMPDDNIAKTDRPVTLDDGQLRIHAGGMELNSDTRVVKLSGGVRGAYNANVAGSAGKASRRGRDDVF